MISKASVLAVAMVALGGFLPQEPVESAWAQDAGADATEQTKKVRETFADMGKELGGLTPDEQKDVDDLVTELGKQYKAQPETMPKSQDDFFGKVLPRFRAALNVAHKAQFDAMMKKQSGQTDATLKSVKLHQLGVSTTVYAREHNGALPATLDDFAPGEDFVWLGSKRNLRELNASFVLAHLKPEQAKEGNSFLLVDGSVQSFDAAQSTAILAELKTGRNPSPEMKKAMADAQQKPTKMPATNSQRASTDTPQAPKAGDQAQAVVIPHSGGQDCCLSLKITSLPKATRADGSIYLDAHCAVGIVHNELIGAMDGDRCPKDLGSAMGKFLMKEKYHPKVCFLAAGSKLPADWTTGKRWTQEAKSDWFNKNSDYVYLASPAMTHSALPGDFILFYTKPAAFSKGSYFYPRLGGPHFFDSITSAKIITELTQGKNPSPAMEKMLEELLQAKQEAKEKILSDKKKHDSSSTRQRK